MSAGIGIPENTIESFDANFCRSYSLSSNAIWCTPIGVVALDLKTGLLARLPIDTPLTRGPVGLTMRAEQPASEALEMLVVQIRAAATDDSAVAHPG